MTRRGSSLIIKAQGELMKKVIDLAENELIDETTLYEILTSTINKRAEVETDLDPDLNGIAYKIVYKNRNYLFVAKPDNLSPANDDMHEWAMLRNVSALGDMSKGYFEVETETGEHKIFAGMYNLFPLSIKEEFGRVFDNPYEIKKIKKEKLKQYWQAFNWVVDSSIRAKYVEVYNSKSQSEMTKILEENLKFKSFFVNCKRRFGVSEERDKFHFVKIYSSPYNEQEEKLERLKAIESFAESLKLNNSQSTNNAQINSDQSNPNNKGRNQEAGNKAQGKFSNNAGNPQNQNAQTQHIQQKANKEERWWKVEEDRRLILKLLEKYEINRADLSKSVDILCKMKKRFRANDLLLDQILDSALKTYLKILTVNSLSENAVDSAQAGDNKIGISDLITNTNERIVPTSQSQNSTNQERILEYYQNLVLKFATDLNRLGVTKAEDVQSMLSCFKLNIQQMDSAKKSEIVSSVQNEIIKSLAKYRNNLSNKNQPQTLITVLNNLD